MTPFRTPKVLQWLYPTLQWQKGRKVYLTFDDGPVPEVTEFVLETLAKFDIKATFFCIGDNVKKHPEVFQKVLQAGHSIGNHTMHHLYGWQTKTQDYLEDIAKCEEQLKPHLQSKKLFRPPYGRIKRAAIKKLKEEYEIIMWTTLSQDYDQRISPTKCLKETIKATKPGSIVVFHDSQKAFKNLQYVLPRYLEELKGQFEFDKL
ncbi:polysaccharide deacetylase family protein [Jiulongibacter sp. NS-SX5]|uniref:polysaccharide deacetylase family protein n=1 Tax=Jiulongibacter sp. NS-SX5 TaxID=3463854 RepID=UPI004059539F